MNPSSAHAAFEGVSGSIIVSITAFTIVFAVLMGLTAVIYAIKIFSEGENGTGKKAPAAPAPVSQAVSAPAAPVVRGAGDSAKIVAAITAAILSATGGQGRVLSVMPEGVKEQGARWTRTWRTAALMEQVGNRLSRPWNH